MKSSVITIANTRPSITALSRRYPRALMVMEVGMHSPWTSRFLNELGHRVLVANPRKLRAIYTSDRKSDKNDARMDPQLLHPMEHGTEEAQRDLLQVKLRDNLVRQLGTDFARYLVFCCLILPFASVAGSVILR